MIHLGDITKISGYDAPPVDCIIGGSPCQDLSVAGKRAGLAGQRSGLFMEQIRIVKEMRDADRLRGRTGQFIKPRYMVWENVCFAAGTLVTCDGGYKNIEDVAIGDKVKTLSGEYRPVAACYKTPKVEVMSVKASGSEPLTVTTNHPFWAREKSYAVNGQREYGAPQWVEAGKLTKKHMIAYRLDIPTLPDDFISTDVAWALGRWLADGSVDLNRSNPRIFISCGKSKVDATRERLNKLPYEIYENSPHSTAVNFSFTSFEFYRLIESAGKGAGNKKVPPFVFELPVGLQKSFLDGYLSGDGYSRCRNGSIEFSASTASRQLAYGIARVFRNVYHAQASVSRHKAKEGTISGRKIHANYPSYSIGAVINGKCQRWFYEDGVIWAPVISVERNGETANVYNLSVIGDNTYGANDIMVHNCGAFSSNHGEDFRAVLEETIRIADPEAPDIPLPEKGKWPLADAWYGDGWSVAYRVLDAQFWGVPQRRRRIALVADFGGQSAPEILFVRKGVCGDFETSGETREVATAGTGTSAYPAIARSLTARYDGSPCIDRGPDVVVQGGMNCLTPWDVQSRRIYTDDGAWPSLYGGEGGGHGYIAINGVQCLTPSVFDARGNGNGETVPTITGDHNGHIPDFTALVCSSQAIGEYKANDVTSTISARDYKSARDLVLTAADSRYCKAVRRLTPTECERLQGYPDNYTDIGEWTDSKGKTHQTSDAARYKAMGNSIALPPWKWVLKRLCAMYERDATLGSLFDGVGGFSLIWERLNGPGTCLFASEIEPFCIAVTKKRFGGSQ